MHMHVYIITLAENAETAKSSVRSWLDDYADREFFDYGGLEEPEKVVLVSEARDDLEAAKAETERLLPIIENDISEYKKLGNRGMEGYSHVRYGNILNQSCTSDMPFFNMEDWDWSIPEKIPCFEGKELEGMNWYAVMADLHF